MIQLGKYKHYKGKDYEVIGVAKHSETLEELVVYKALYDEGQLWVRPLKMFAEEVEVDGKQVKRFEVFEISENNDFKICAFGIILNKQQEVLICHRRDYDLWNLPCGGVMHKESPWEAVIREVKEEVGLEVKVNRLTGIYHKPDKDEIAFVFICEIIGGEIAISDEVDEIKYCAVNDIPKNFPPHQRERIIDAISGQFTLKDQFGPSSIELLKAGKL